VSSILAGVFRAIGREARWATRRSPAGRASSFAGGFAAGAVRSVAPAEETVAVLRRHGAVQDLRRASCGEGWTETGLVFDRGDGALLEPHAARRRLPAACRAAGVPEVSPHALRHAHARMLADASEELLVIQRRLGHSRPSMAAHYARPDVERQRGAAERVARALGRGPRDNDRDNGAGKSAG
jgi:integrase